MTASGYSEDWPYMDPAYWEPPPPEPEYPIEDYCGAGGHAYAGDDQPDADGLGGRCYCGTKRYPTGGPDEADVD